MILSELALQLLLALIEIILGWNLKVLVDLLRERRRLQAWKNSRRFSAPDNIKNQ